MFLLSLASKIIAINMIKMGAHRGDECPAESVIPKFFIGKDRTLSFGRKRLMFIYN